MSKGISFEAIVANLQPVTVHFLGLEAEVNYRPAAITPRFRRLLNRPDDADREATIEALIALVDNWEITRGGAMWPLTVEALTDMPYELMNAVLTAIMEDFNSPKP